MASPDERLRDLGLELPEPLAPVATYRMARRHGHTLWLSGHVCFALDGSGVIAGKVGGELSLDQGYQAARITTLHLLSTLRAAAGSLDAVHAILKVFGMVNAAPGFVQIPQVVDGCTDLLVDVFGEDAGKPARAAVGMAELPLGAAVEIDLVAALRGPEA
jgi:enamine deaminase RidA (YjgF/YER057c/UK114 family)